ncbi:N-acetyltaurine hydrolase [Parasteatoda tepidariorum]|uniref:N-acetyltaurine hydrolase n=1 Tax=Parasteatoda tepidariorum TaxID=114398 RepID=UPI0039BD7A53
MDYFKSNGGGTIVDNCSIGLRANGQADYLEELSQSTGVKIVAGSGFYVSGSQSQSTLHMSVETLCEKLRQDLLVGMDGTNIKCGCIGEVGCSWPITDFEKKSLVSTAIVQEETGAPVIIHPGRDSRCPEEIFRVFQEAGGRVSNTVMSHLDRTLLTKESLLEFASLGSYCEFDLFGIEVSLYQLDELIPMPSDAQRMESLRCLIQEGYGDKIVVAHDIHTKHRLMKYGGHGYSHILLNIVPIMKSRGFHPEDVRKILYTNPASWLTFH